MAMSIYLNTNILYGARTFSEPKMLALRILANQLGQQIFLPSVVAVETENQYRRRLGEATEGVSGRGARDVRYG